MAVVINELEMAPVATKEGPAGQQVSQTGTPPLTPDLLREIEEAFHKKQERLHRLMAY
jgi:hypothetical protein